MIIMDSITLIKMINTITVIIMMINKRREGKGRKGEYILNQKSQLEIMALI